MSYISRGYVALDLFEAGVCGTGRHDIKRGKDVTSTGTCARCATDAHAEWVAVFGDRKTRNQPSGRRTTDGVLITLTREDAA